MPHADPETSVEVAARHLFRHICDATELRRNPLVRAFFAGPPDPVGDAAALTAIHARVLHEARVRCSEDGAGGPQAVRQHAIVAALCAGESPAHTEATLKLSRRQYYRDRHAVCTSIAEALVPRSNPTSRIEVYDPLRLLFGRAASLSDQGFAQKGVGLLDKAWSGIPAGEPRSLARLALADALILVGDVTRAGKLLSAARGLVDGRAIDGEDPSRLSDRTLLTEARLATATGKDAAAGPALDALANRQIAANRGDEVALETLVECGFWHCSNARFGEARRMLRRARDIARDLAHIAPQQHVALALLEAYCVEDYVDLFDGSHRRFREALAISSANASMRGTLEATTGLMGYYASIGSDDAMYDLAQSALEIARAMEGRRHLLFAAAWIGTTLMKTTYWRAVSPLLFEVEQLSPPGTLYWTFVKEAQADFLSRTGRYEAAQASFAAAQDAARTLNNRKWQAIVLRDVGVMLGRLGRAEESADSLRQAVALAEGGAGAWSLALTYRAASQVLAGARSSRLPKQPAWAARRQHGGGRGAPLALDPRPKGARV